MHIEQEQIIADAARLIEEARELALMSQRIMDQSYQIMRASQALTEKEKSQRFAKPQEIRAVFPQHHRPALE